jgi:hypothetical protein
MIHRDDRKSRGTGMAAAAILSVQVAMDNVDPRSQAGASHPVTGRTELAHQGGMIESCGHPGVGIVAGIALAGRRDVIGWFSGRLLSVMAGGTLTGGGGIVRKI